MNLGFFAQVTQATINLVTTHGPIFDAIGMNLFRGIVVVLVIWEGFLIAFHAKPANQFASLLVSIAVTYAALTFYTQPFPGVGKNLTQIVTDAGSDLANTLDTATHGDVIAGMAQVISESSGSSWSSLTNPYGIVRYYILTLVLLFAQVVLLGVIAFGFVAVGMIVLVGKLFIPWLLVPGMDWLAWGWFRSLVTYSFYPVIGNAFVYIYGTIWLNWRAQYGPINDNVSLAVAFTGMAVLTLAGVYGILKIPSFVGGLFSGTGGLTAFSGYKRWRA